MNHRGLSNIVPIDPALLGRDKFSAGWGLPATHKFYKKISKIK